MHKPKEKLEILYRTCPELCKIKSGDCSTRGIHEDYLTGSNALRNLAALELNVGKEVCDKYRGYMVKKMPWPVEKPEETMEFNLP